MTTSASLQRNGTPGHFDNRIIITVVFTCAAAATFHGAAHAATTAGVIDPINFLYPVMGDGLAIAAFRQTRIARGAMRAFAWCVMATAAAASGAAQSFVLAAGKEGGDAALAVGMGAAPAVVVLLVTILGASAPEQSAPSTEAVDGGPAEELAESSDRSPVEPDPSPPAAEVPPATVTEVVTAEVPEPVTAPPAISEFRPRVLPGGGNGARTRKSAPARPAGTRKRKHDPAEVDRIMRERGVSARQARNILNARAGTTAETAQEG